MNNSLYGNLQVREGVTTLQNFDSPNGATTVYIATNTNLRVTTDGVTTPTASVGLVVPANSTAVFACRHNTVNAVRVLPEAAANISVQFLGSER